MKIIPECAVTTLDACKAGQAVRLLGYSSGEWALVSELHNRPGERALIILGEVDSPTYQIYPDPRAINVLAYADEVLLDIDQAEPFEPPFHNLSEKNGAILRNGSEWFMNVQSGNSRGLRHEVATYDIGNHILIERVYDFNRMAMFGKWDIYLGNMGWQRERWVRIFSFNLEPQKEG